MVLPLGLNGEVVESRIEIVQGRASGEFDVEIELRFPGAIRKRDSGQISIVAARERFQFRIEHRKWLDQHQLGLSKGVVQPGRTMTDTHVEHSPGRESSRLSIGEARREAT